MNKATIKKFNSSQYGIRLKSSQSEFVRMKKILELVGKKKLVLDLGCDDGEIAELLAKNNNKIEGVDVSKPAVKLARKRGIKIYEYDLENVKWSKIIGQKFDIVFAGEIIEHIYDTDAFLENVRDVLKRNGELILTTPNIASLGRRIFLLFGKNPYIETSLGKTDAGHIRYFTFSSLIELLRKHGFRTSCQCSTVLNFDRDGKFSSEILARIFPQLGSTIIIKSTKI